MYTGSNKQSQTQYAVGSDTIGDLINNFSFGGIVGVELAIIMAAQALMLDQNYQLAKSYYNTNKADFDFFQSTYEGNMASANVEARNRPFYSPDYISNTGRAMARASTLDRKWFYTRRNIPKYNVGLGRRVDYKFSVAKYGAELEGWNIGFRYEDTRKQKYDEQRHAHQTEILNIGIGAGNAARAGLATAVDKLSDARSQIASNLGSLGNGLATNIAYNNTTNAVGKLTPNQLASASRLPKSAGVNLGTAASTG